jgi:hypothetical protein
MGGDNAKLIFVGLKSINQTEQKAFIIVNNKNSIHSNSPAGFCRVINVTVLQVKREKEFSFLASSSF